MKTRFWKGALCGSLVLAGLATFAGCKTKPYCEDLGNCGGDMLVNATDIWKLDGLVDREWIVTSGSVATAAAISAGMPATTVVAGGACQDQLQIPPAPISLLRQPPVQATQRPPDTVTADWCSNLVLKPDGSIERFIVYAPPVPLKIGDFSLSADYDGNTTRGTYAMQITWDQQREFDFSETCLTSQGIRPTCPELGRNLGDFLAAEANIYSVRCFDPPGNEGGCHCQYELSFIGGPNGRWSLDPNNPGEINFFDDSFAPPMTADYCATGKNASSLELTGHDDAALFNQKSLRTLKLAAPTCSDGAPSRTLGEEGVDCGGQCQTACGSCTDGIANDDEEGIDCGGSCLGTFCDPDPTITDKTKRHDACDNGKKDPWEEGVDCGGFCKNADSTDATCCKGTDGVLKPCCLDNANQKYDIPVPGTAVSRSACPPPRSRSRRRRRTDNMTTQRRLGILVAAVALLTSTSAFAKRHKPKPPVTDTPATEEPATEVAPATVTASTSVADDAKPASDSDKKPAEATETPPSAPVEATSAPAPAAKPKLEMEQPAAVEAAPPIAPPPLRLKSNGNADSPDGVTWKASGWNVTMYGYAALNVMQDSTQSFGTALGNTIIQRRGTIRGNELQAQATARDSRLGMRFQAPDIGNIRSSVNIEADFNAPPPVEYTEANSVTQAGFRMRHYYMKVETPVVDIIAGQYHDLFGWGGKGFYPSTLAFLGITGEIYHRQPQIRLSKTLGGDAVEFEMAAAALRPVQKAGGYPDVEAGLRLAFNRWTGARQQAYGQPSIGALEFGVSGIGRHFEVAQFLETPGGTVPGTGWGVAGNAFIPVIPATSAKKRGNSLSLTGEYSRGTGIADMYSDLTGGLLFPQLPNSQDREDPTNPPPVYPPNIDSGIVTFDGDNRLRTCDWEGFVVGLQYYLPVLDGRVWVSAIHSQVKSDNIVEITPLAGIGGVFNHAWYYDGTLFVAITDSIQAGLALQRVDQTLGDGVKVQNYRTELGMHMFF